ncbi:respiratory nitrite reductase specific cytochrome c biogenesis protein NrfK /respiratory nitrite reductase specific cytochrome c biogenesis protein NrfL [Lutibacter agarilyticus]|uniref:Respiratory nitrite reductase specific cytochrome c biogenesis protein NrfK /respiratory nitrite reductase specific cytochrome c biogenesis protein NrfL n=1 Tax=Lutibacter agarilyticus TaxID=1109740 RepID=A0A238W3U1_9FLAO|nr:cytochrome c biogenesis protein ResB [Lutibacter agarilyticus]SNR41067.1 respiratory nitrite reductase specific cytochrome c biogenesis protein NrfK /respiratory nitrite reductase specific cytochrome c biogenesis protein NrfL [Lutibacter agarilyticus]
MSENNSNIQRNLWENPWGYIESFFIGFGLMLTGFLIEAFVTTNGNIFTIKYPYNVIALAGYIIVLFICYKWFTSSQVIRWLTKVPASISSIVLITILVMIMGTVPQVPSTNNFINKFGLNHITTNWAFLLILFQFLTCLGLVSIKRILQFKWDNFGFVLNHVGLFLALTAGVLGSGDLQRLSINVYEGKPSWIATDAERNEVELPFAFYLKDFLIEEYNPKLALVDNSTGSISHNDGKNLYLVEKGETYYFNNFEVTIENYLPNAIRFGMRYEPVNEQGSPPAAYISVKNIENDSIQKAWISSGSFRYPYESLKISEAYSMVMTIPEAKKFSSDIDILTKDGERISTILEVNKAFKYKGWKIYQLSYDDKMGKWSNLSVLELVKDPWLPLIYLGIFMMIAGAIYMFWVGNKITKNENE